MSQENELVVAAAADLQSVTSTLDKGFGDPPIRFVVAASGVLARQIENGAPFDAFLSANAAYVTDLVSSGRLQRETVRIYAVGRLGYWSPAGVRWADLKPGSVRHLAIANPQHAPYGRAARQALERTGRWQGLQPSIVYGENVRQALQFADTGNAEAVLTAWSLVRGRGGELIDTTLHEPLRQTAAVVAGRPRAQDAQRFVAWLTSEQGQAILREHGFSSPDR